jgi:hypothetical protein
MDETRIPRRALELTFKGKRIMGLQNKMILPDTG